MHSPICVQKLGLHSGGTDAPDTMLSTGVMVPEILGRRFGAFCVSIHRLCHFSNVEHQLNSIARLVKIYAKALP